MAYRELGFEDESLPSLWSLGPDIVVQVGTTSKTLFPGVRLGWAAGPAEVVDRLVAAKQLTDQCAGALGQRLFEESERRGWIDEQLARSRALYRRKCERMLAALDALDAGVGAVDDAARRLLLVADAAGASTLSSWQSAPSSRALPSFPGRSSSRTAGARTASASPSASSTKRRSTRGSRASGRSCD